MQSEPQQQSRIRTGTILLGGLVCFIVRGFWSWKTFVHQPESVELVNILGLFVETVTFTVAFFLLRKFEDRRRARRQGSTLSH